MNRFSLKLIFLSVLISLAGCGKKEEANPTLEYVKAIINEVEQEYAPDRRTARFDTEIIEKDNQIIIKGLSTNNNAIQDFRDKMNEKGISFTDSLVVLPPSELKNKTGIINNSVANIRTTKGDASELATQALLGTPVKVFQKIGVWYMIQTPDDYIAWIDGGELVLKNPTELNTWLSKPKVIFTETYGKSYTEASETSQMVSDLVAGDILALTEEKNDYYQVEYPDGRVAYILKKEAKLYNDWLNTLKVTEKSLATTSKELMGLPYLWGGTSSKGVDCSGFTKTIYFLNGMIIPRDASQQVHEGKLIDDKKDYDKLQVGDLLFFGRITPEGKEKVVHVGMWIGNNEYIHSSGRVRINSVDPEASNYNEYNEKRYLRSKRYLSNSTKGIQQLKDKMLFTKAQLQE